jgi:hypothetical protein
MYQKQLTNRIPKSYKEHKIVFLSAVLEEEKDVSTGI